MPNKKAEAKPEEKKSKAKVIKVNPAGENDEVFYHSDNPYQTGAIYPKSGTYKVGDTIDDADLVPPSVVQGNIEPAVG